MVVTKAELVKLLAKKMHGHNKQLATQFVESFFETMCLALEKGDEVKLPGLGNFRVRTKKARPGRNPKTGEDVMISARRVVTFQSSLKLKAEIHQKNN
jgi:integration host factor subunit alpha